MKKPLRKQTQATVKQLTNLLAFSMSLKHLHVLQFLTSQKLLLWPNLTHSLKKRAERKVRVRNRCAAENHLSSVTVTKKKEQIHDAPLH